MNAQCIENRTFDEIAIGDEARLSRTLTWTDIELFAAMSRDVKPAHVDQEFAKSDAAKVGVRQHHWPYGNMPPQPQVSEAQVAAIVQYVRELQVANGIAYRPHRM